MICYCDCEQALITRSIERDWVNALDGLVIMVNMCIIEPYRVFYDSHYKRLNVSVFHCLGAHELEVPYIISSTHMMEKKKCWESRYQAELSILCEYTNYGCTYVH